MNRRIAFMIFLTALVLRLGYIGFIYDGPESLVQEDSGLYLLLADTLKQSYVTGMAIPDDLVGMFTERTPGYMYFVAGFKTFVSDSHLPIVIAQAIIDAIVCVLGGYLAGFFHQRLVLPAGMLAAFNVNMIVNSSLILSDGPFMLPFIGGLIASAAYIRAPSFAAALAATVLFSGALLVRPVLLYFPPVLILFFVITAWRHRIPVVQSLSHIGVIALGFVLIIGPMLLRNQKDYGHLAYVSQTGTHALFWIYPQAQEFANGVPREESVAEMRAQLQAYQDKLEVPGDQSNPFVTNAELKTVASRALWEMGFWPIVKAWSVGSVINLTSPGIVSSPLVRRMVRPSFISTPGANPVEKIWNYFAANKLFTLVMLPAAALTMLSWLVAGLSLLQLRPRISRLHGEKPPCFLDPAQTLFLLVVGAYILAVTGPVVGVKYRLPLEPMFDIFLAASLLWCVDRWMRQRARAHHSIGQ